MTAILLRGTAAVCGGAEVVVPGVWADAAAEIVTSRSGNQILFMVSDLTAKCGERQVANLRIWFCSCCGYFGGVNDAVAGFLLLYSAMKARVISIASAALTIPWIFVTSRIRVMPRALAKTSSALPMSS